MLDSVASTAILYISYVVKYAFRHYAWGHYAWGQLHCVCFNCCIIEVLVYKVADWCVTLISMTAGGGVYSDIYYVFSYLKVNTV